MKIDAPDVLRAAAGAEFHPRYRPDIDGLRAVAVLAVVLYHAFPSLVRGGFAGVDIFFVISGFLITTIICNGLRDDRFSFAEFYARRIRRIFPALLLVMGACAAFGWFALFPDEYKMLGKHIVGGSGFMSNLFLWNEVGYFDKASDTKPLLHLWSLGIEEQFYIAWPVILLLAHKSRVSLFKTALALGLLSLLVNLAGVNRFPSATFYSLASRAWELLLGALVGLAASGHIMPARIAAWNATPGWTSTRMRDLRSVTGLLLLGVTGAFLRQGAAFPGWWALLPTAGAALLIGAGPQAWVNRHILSNRVLVWIGLISYPLYLWHWPLLSFAHIIESALPSAMIRGVAVLAAAVLAWLTFLLLERPLRRIPGRLPAIVLALLMAALALAGGVIYKQGGNPQRGAIVESAQWEKSLFLVEDAANAAACKKRYGFSTLYEYCLLYQVDKEPTVALVGDSHAYHMVAGLTRYYASRGDNLLMLGTRIPYFGIDPNTDDYQKATARMLDIALNTPSIKTVIISTAAKLSKGAPLVDNLRQTLRRFVDAGKQVVFINDNPMLDFEPRACIRRAGVPSSHTRTDCSITRAAFDAATADHDAQVQLVLHEFPSVEQFSTAAYLCDAARCHVVIDGKMLYRDRDHLSYDGDLYLGERYAHEQDARHPRSH